MKKYFSIVFMCFCLFLSGCSYKEDLRKEQMKITEENYKVENVLAKYDENIEQVNQFNALIKENIFDITNILYDYSSFSNKHNMTEVVQYLREKIIENCSDYVYRDGVIQNEDYIEIYPFFDEDNGKIFDYILIQSDTGSLLFITEWEKGQIVNYSTS